MLIQRNSPLGTLLLLVYYNRPVLVRNALASVLASHEKYPHWRLAVLDDGSDAPAEPVVREVLKDHVGRVAFYNSRATWADKAERGVTVGGIANRAIRESDQPLCVTLCDDDELHPDYLCRLDRFFRRRPDVHYCYSNVLLYNPFTQRASDVTTLTGPYNAFTGPINCYGKVDGSQVAFRTTSSKSNAIWYGESTVVAGSQNPFLSNLDGELFKKFHDRFGPAPYTGLVSQYKGIHEHQLVFFKEHVFKDKDDVLRYCNSVSRLAGEVF